MRGELDDGALINTESQGEGSGSIYPVVQTARHGLRMVDGRISRRLAMRTPSKSGLTTAPTSVTSDRGWLSTLRYHFVITGDGEDDQKVCRDS